MVVGRRSLVLGGVATFAATVAGGAYVNRLGQLALKTSANKFYELLPLPELIDARKLGNAVSLSAQKGIVEFFSGFETETYGYSALYLGPVIRVYRGDTVAVKVTNQLDSMTTLHWHGLLVSSDRDGGPYHPIAPGQSWQPELKIDQPPSTVWFHPHPNGDTGRQVYMGLTGLMYIEDERAGDLGLPSQYGVDDIPIVLQDRTFGADGEFVYERSPEAVSNGVRGNTILINGAIGPVAEVPKGIVRLRLLNGANARNFRLRFDNRRSMHVVAGDQGFLSVPVSVSELTIAPGERFEMLVDFSDGEIAVLHAYPDGNGVPLNEISREWDELTSDILGTFTPIIRFDPMDEIPPNIRYLPKTLVDREKADVTRATRRRTFVFGRTTTVDGSLIKVEEPGSKFEEAASRRLAGHQTMGINGKAFDLGRLDVTINQGNTEIWEMRGTDMAHPIHIHGATFTVLHLDGSPPPPHLTGSKDTVLINEKAELFVSFDRTADPANPFVFHCQILEHADAGMMASYIVV